MNIFIKEKKLKIVFNEGDNLHFVNTFYFCGQILVLESINLL